MVESSKCRQDEWYHTYNLKSQWMILLQINSLHPWWLKKGAMVWLIKAGIYFILNHSTIISFYYGRSHLEKLVRWIQICIVSNIKVWKYGFIVIMSHGNTNENIMCICSSFPAHFQRDSTCLKVIISGTGTGFVKCSKNGTFKVRNL